MSSVEPFIVEGSLLRRLQRSGSRTQAVARLATSSDDERTVASVPGPEYLRYPLEVIIDGAVAYWRLGDTQFREIVDSFNRPDQVGLGETETGETWVESITGYWGINSNQVYRINTNSIYAGVVVDIGTPDSVTEATVAVKSRDSGVVARWTDNNNHYLLRHSLTSPGEVGLLKKVGGVWTTLQNVTSPINNGDRIKLDCTGSTLVGFLNGVQVVSATDTTLTGTRCGLWSYGASGSREVRYDDFKVTLLNTTAIDASSNQLHGEYFGGLLFEQEGGIVHLIPPDVDTAVAFDGVDGRMVVPDHILLDFGADESFALELWFKTSATMGTLVSKGLSPYPYRLELAGGALVASRNDGVNAPSVTSGLVNDNVWHYAYVGSDGTTLTLQIDDGVPATVVDSTAVTMVNASVLALGMVDNTNFYAGSLDEVALYRNILTPEQRDRHYKAGKGQAV